MKFRVKKGTPNHGTNLCESCKHAQITKGMSESQRVIHCHAYYPTWTVAWPVSECSEYRRKDNSASLIDMKEIAWVIVPRKGRSVGFVSPEQFERLDRKDTIKKLEKITQEGIFETDSD